MERIFRALSDPSRRRLLDELFQRDGQTVSELDAVLPDVTRFATMKHLRLLEAAGLVATRRAGRSKLHFLNPVPIRLVHDRWIQKYAEPVVSAMSSLKRRMEGHTMSSGMEQQTGAVQRLKHVYEVIIQTTAENLWEAMTDPDITEKYFYKGRVETSWREGDPIQYRMPDGKIAIEGMLLEVEPTRLLSHTWHALWDEKIRAEAPSKVTWEITPMGGACKLTVLHFDMGPEALHQVSGGIVYIVSGLKSLLETGRPLSDVSM